MSEKMNPVVDEDKLVKKKPSNKIKESFIKQDLSDLKNIIIFDWIIPGIQNMILDTLSQMFFKTGYGRIGQYDRGRIYDGRNAGRIDYRGYSSRRDERRMDRDYDDSPKHSYNNIILIDRPSAEKVLRALYDEIKNRGQVSVAQFMELVNLPNSYTDYSWGWTRTEDIRIRRVYEGFLIDVTEPIFIG